MFESFLSLCPSNQCLDICWVQLQCFCTFLHSLFIFIQFGEANSTIGITHRTHIIGNDIIWGNLQCTCILCQRLFILLSCIQPIAFSLCIIGLS
eukprot:Gb_03311 [translate_table: standard]